MSGLQDYTADLIVLAELAGVSASPAIFRIINELLEMGMTPEDIHGLLKRISSISSTRENVPGKSEASNQ